MSKRKDLIRNGDRVRILNPEVILRVGYPLSKDEVKTNMITDDQKTAITNMLKAFGCSPNPVTLFLDLNEIEDTYLYDKVTNLMAYEILKQKNFGGRERKLHTTFKESLRHKCGRVVGRRVVKTGMYHSGNGGYGYEGDYDYEPAYLEGEKTHVLFQILVERHADVCYDINKDGGVWIDKVNLELYDYDKQEADERKEQETLLC